MGLKFQAALNTLFLLSLLNNLQQDILLFFRNWWSLNHQFPFKANI